MKARWTIDLASGFVVSALTIMGGSNPYIPASETRPAEKAFRIRFQPGDQSFQIDPLHRPEVGIGLPGSILDLAMGLDIDIDHACGGVAACSTCHVIVKEGLASCNESSEAEEDQLDKAPGVNPQSRLACQCVPDGSQDLVVQIPNWNRNLVREGN